MCSVENDTVPAEVDEALNDIYPAVKREAMGLQQSVKY